MSQKAFFMSKPNTCLLLFLLILLSLIILSFPVRLSYEYSPVQSLDIFGDNLLLFAVLYYIWLLLIVWPLFLPEKRSYSYQSLSLVSLFFLVHEGFWALIMCYGNAWEELYNMGHVRYLEAHSKLPSDFGNLEYFNFPGFHFLITALTLISGQEAFNLRTPLLLLFGLLFSVVCFLAYHRSFASQQTSSLPMLTTLLLLQGNLLITARLGCFYPPLLAFCFLSLFWLVIDRKGYMVIRLILFFAVTIIHLPTSLAFLFILIGVFIVGKSSKENLVTPSTIMLLAVIILAWELYHAVFIFNWGVSLFEIFVNYLKRGEMWWYFFQTAEANWGEKFPLWFRIVRSFWLALIPVLGSILAVRNLFRIKKLSLREKLETGGVLGVILMGISVMLFGSGGEYRRFLEYIGLVAAPIVVRFFSSLRIQDRRFAVTKPLKVRALSGVAILVIIFYVLSFPTFLAHNNMVSTAATYPYELACGEFLQSSYRKDSSLTIFGDPWVNNLVFYFPTAKIERINTLAKDKEEFLGNVGANIALFRQARNGERSNSIFVATERITQQVEHKLDIHSDAPELLELMETGLSSANKIYDNGHNRIYVNRD